MKQTSILALIAIGICLSGFTWAGPPDTQEPQEDVTSDAPETESYGSATEADTLEVSDQETIETLTFEEAVAVCSDREDLQACIDEKTGQAQTMEKTPMESELPEPEPEVNESTDEWTDDSSGPE